MRFSRFARSIARCRPLFEALLQIMANRYRNRGFADAAGAYDGYKACGGELIREPQNVV